MFESVCSTIGRKSPLIASSIVTLLDRGALLSLPDTLRPTFLAPRAVLLAVPAATDLSAGFSIPTVAPANAPINPPLVAAKSNSSAAA